MSNPNTIFFEGFTTDFTTDFTQVGANLDPTYWIKPSGVGSVDQHPRLDPVAWNDGSTDTKFNMYKLSPHDGTDKTGHNRVYTGQGVIALTGFPQTFNEVTTDVGNNGKEIRGIGIGFYINKLASEPSGINHADSHAQRLIKIYNSNFDDYSSDFANASGVIEIDVIHSTGAPSGYSDTFSVNDSRNLSLRVRTPDAAGAAWNEKYFDTNVLGSTWNYLQPADEANYTRTDQRIISTFTEAGDKAAGIATFSDDDYYNGLFVEISILPTGDGAGSSTNSHYEMQIRLNGMNLYERGKTQADQTLTGLEGKFFHDDGTPNVFFDRIDWYGSRTGIKDHNDVVDNDFTWIDDIYIVANTGVCTGPGASCPNFNHADNFLGASTKVFALFPDSTGINQSGSWRQFSADNGYNDINVNGNVFQYLQDDDGDNTYVYAENNNNALMFDFDNITIDSALNINNYIIGGIKITNSSRAVSTGVTFQNVFTPSGDLPLANDSAVSGIGEIFEVSGTVYKYQNQYLMDNPITEVKWTPTEINDGHFGIIKKS